MKIRHAEIESVRSNPGAWVTEKKSPTAGHPKLGYDGVLRNAIGSFHATQSRAEAEAYLGQSIKTNQFKDVDRIERIETALNHYIDWCEGEGLIVVDRRVVIDRPYTPFISLGGVVWRVDSIPEGLRGVVLGDYEPDWRSELRFPLLQRALADRYARPIEEIFIGCQALNASGLAIEHFESGTINEGEREFLSLCRAVEEFWTEGSG